MIPVHTRWLCRSDMPDVLWIERNSFPHPWPESDFLVHLRRRCTIGMVAECGDRVVGFTLYELQKDGLEVVNFAVRPDCRRSGVGRQMVAKLVGKLSSHRRTRIIAATREANLGMQLFLKACGFAARQILPGHFEDTGETAYVFEYRLPAAREVETVL
jgi:[ribosomal protein S18]-alanine N-acetyltransferase